MCALPPAFIKLQGKDILYRKSPNDYFFFVITTLLQIYICPASPFDLV